MMKIAEETAKNILDFLARKAGFENVILYSFSSSKHESRPLILLSRRSSCDHMYATTSLFYERRIDAWNNVDLKYAAMPDKDGTSSAEILDVLLSICVKNNLFVMNNGKVFLKKGTTLENLLVEMDLDGNRFQTFIIANSF